MDGGGRTVSTGRGGCLQSFLFSRHRFRARHLLPHGLLARRRGAVEAGNSISALGGMGKLRLRRAAIHFLSSAVVAPWSPAREVRSLECGNGGVGGVPADAGRRSDVRPAAEFGREPLWRSMGRGLLYR